MSSKLTATLGTSATYPVLSSNNTVENLEIICDRTTALLMSNGGDEYTKYPDLPFGDDVCRLSRHQYDDFRRQISDESSNSSVETYVHDEHISRRAFIRFRVRNNRLYIAIGLNEYRMKKVSDLPGTDRVLRPSNSRLISQRQVRLYKKWSQFLMGGQIFFTGPFHCVNHITGASPSSPVHVEADRPVPLHKNYIPEGSFGLKICSLGLGRGIGKRMYHVSNSGNVNLQEVNNDLLYFGSPRMRSIQSDCESSSSSGVEEMNTGSEEDVEADYCDCTELVMRYREAAAKYGLQPFADQVLRDLLHHQITNNSSNDTEYTTQVHVCRKYRVRGFLEATELFDFEAFFYSKPRDLEKEKRIWLLVAQNLRRLVDFDTKVSSGEYEVIRVDVRRRFIVSRREVRRVRELCRLGKCVCEIARKSNLSVREVHGLLLRVRGSHTNRVFGACYANRNGVYTGERTGSEQGCICLENSLTLQDVIGIVCNQFGQPIDETRSGLYPVIEIANGYAHIFSWSREETFLPDGIDLQTKIAGSTAGVKGIAARH